jgi:hypothetical protein
VARSAQDFNLLTWKGKPTDHMIRDLMLEAARPSDAPWVVAAVVEAAWLDALELFLPYQQAHFIQGLTIERPPESATPRICVNG